MMNKEVSDSLHMLLHCALKDKEFETQKQQFDLVCNYIKDLQQRIDKAIEYINKAQLPMNDEYLTEFDCGVELLEILGGKE